MYGMHTYKINISHRKPSPPEIVNFPEVVVGTLPTPSFSPPSLSLSFSFSAIRKASILPSKILSLVGLAALVGAGASSPLSMNAQGLGDTGNVGQ